MALRATMGDEIPPVGLKPTRPEQITLESWSQGFMVGSLIIMAAITLGNMRSGVMLHKLILIEVRQRDRPQACVLNVLIAGPAACPRYTQRILCLL